MDLGKEMKAKTAAITTSSFDKASENLIKPIEEAGFKAVDIEPARKQGIIFDNSPNGPVLAV